MCNTMNPPNAADGELPENLFDGLDFLDDEEDDAVAAGPRGDLTGGADLAAPFAAVDGSQDDDGDGGGDKSGGDKSGGIISRPTCSSDDAARRKSGAQAETSPPPQQEQQPQQEQPHQQQYIPFSEIGPHDVLLGRGQRSYDAQGTILFRRLIAERKEEYLAATKIKRKKEIASELVDHVRNGLDPPGRFLRLVTEAEKAASKGGEPGAAAKPGEDDGDQQLWCLADDKQCLEKAKMTLRQKDTKDTKRDQKAAASAAVKVKVAEGSSEGVGNSATRGKAAGAKGSGKGKRGRNWSGSDASSSGMSTSSHGAATAAAAAAKSPDSSAASTSPFVASPLETSQQQQQRIAQQYGFADSNGNGTLPDGIDSSIHSQQQAYQLGPIQEFAATTPNNPAHLSSSSSSPSSIYDAKKRLEQMTNLQRTLALASQFRRSGGTDLLMLGSILFQNLAGFGHGELNLKGGGSAENSHGYNDASAGASGGEDDVRPQHRRHPQQQGDAYSFLLDQDLPPSLCDVVASLLDPGASDKIQYSAVVQVEQDIQLMVETPGRYLSGNYFGDNVGGRLDLPTNMGDGKRLYGRDGQLSALTQAVERVLLRRQSGMAPAALSGGTTREIIALSGYSGTGKTALVDQMRRPVASMGGSFVSGKFDEAGHVNPLSAIFASFDEFCGDLLCNGSDSATSLKVDIISALHGRGDVSSLASTLPNLGAILASAPSTLSPNTPHNPVGGMEALNRFIFHFRCFIRALATPNHPLLLVLDDCQWADSAALEFITSTLLPSDDEMSSILVVLAYRDNEVGMGHPLKVELNKMSSLGVEVNSIELQNLNRNEVTAFVADSLHMLPRQVFSLATSILSKTDGNPLFVIQFMKSLMDEQILQYSVSSRRWKWDLNTIQSKELAENVVGLMVKKMLSLDMKVQALLKFLACMGHRSDERIVNLFVAVVGAECLLVLVEEGLITRVEGPSTSYKFAHDKVQQAAYSLIPHGDRTTTHLYIGRLLQDKVTQILNASTSASDAETNVIVFAAVDQLSRGAELITIRDKKVDFARLCCIAGERALAISAFSMAAIYLLQGSAMLDETDWIMNYELNLNLFTKCAHAQYVTGNYQGVQITLDPVLKNGRTLQDKYDAYTIVLNTLGAQGKQKDTLSFGLDFLANFGENFPRDPQIEDVMTEFLSLKGALAGKSTDDIKNAPAMEDKTKIATMKLFVTINRYAFQANQNLMSLIIFRAASIVLTGGVCHEASVVFSSLGYIFLVFGNASQGYEYAKLGLALLDRFRNKEYCARVYCVAYGLVFPSAEPFQANIQKLKEGYEEGMQVGDVEWSMILADLYARTALLCGGGDLLPLAEDIRKLTRRMKELSHHMQTMTLPCLQAALNLIDPSVERPNVLSGEAMDEDALLNKALENQRLNVVAIVYFLKLWLSYLFGKHEDAAEMAQKCQRLRKSRPFRGGNEAIETFYTGLVAAETARREQQEDQREFWRTIAAESMQAMENWASLCPWNFSGKLSLMRAEISFTDGNASAAAEAYRASVELAKQHRFVHEEALANERAGMFFSSSWGTSSDADAAERHYLRAQTLYATIGAVRKAKDIEAASMLR